MLVRSIALIMLTLLLSITCWGQQQWPQNDQPETIKIDASLVNLPVVVSDHDGRYIAGLEKGDFEIFEDGVKQPIEFFSSESAPFQVMLVLDVSPSVFDSLPAIQNAAKEFVKSMRPDDQAMLVTFSNDIKVVSRFTNDKDSLKQAIDGISISAGTRLYDTIYGAGKTILRSIHGRKAMILLTDGEDTTSNHFAKDAIDAVVESGALIYVVQYPNYRVLRERVPNNPPFHYDPVPIPAPPTPTQPDLPAGKPERQVDRAHGIFSPVVYKEKESSSFLRDLVKQTGGTLFHSSSYDNLATQMANVSEQLRHIYSLGYYPSNPVEHGGYRKIELKLNQKKAQLRYKRGYQAKAATHN